MKVEYIFKVKGRPVVVLMDPPVNVGDRLRSSRGTYTVVGIEMCQTLVPKRPAGPTGVTLEGEVEPEVGEELEVVL